MKTEDFILLSEMVIAQLSSGSESAWSDEIEFVLFSRVFPLNFRLQFIPLHFPLQKDCDVKIDSNAIMVLVTIP